MRALESWLLRYFEPVEDWRELVGPLLALWSIGVLCVLVAMLGWMDAQHMLPPIR